MMKNPPRGLSAARPRDAGSDFTDLEISVSEIVIPKALDATYRFTAEASNRKYKNVTFPI